MHPTRALPLALLTLALGACGRTPPPLLLTPADPPAAPGALAPRLAADPAGGVVMSWVEERPAAEGGGHALRWARATPTGWGAASTAVAGTDWFVNWADTPGVTPSGPRLVAHWLQKSAAATYAYDVRLAQSEDGRTWRDLGSPHHDGTPTEHGFVSLFPAGSGFGLTWLDGRNTAGGGHEAHAGHGGGGGMTLRAARYAADGTQVEETELDALTCDCCPTDVAAVGGQPFIVYRDRTPDEIRDVYALRHDGTRWSAPRAVARDGWHMPACPVNGPAVAADGQRVAIAWFTAPAEVRQVRFVWSADGGATFDAPLRIDGGAPVGRVEVAMLPDGEALVFWLEQVGAGAELRARRVAPDGTLREPSVLAVTSAARASGFPRAVRDGALIRLGWTEVDAAGVRRVRAAVLDAG